MKSTDKRLTDTNFVNIFEEERELARMVNALSLLKIGYFV